MDEVVGHTLINPDLNGVVAQARGDLWRLSWGQDWTIRTLQSTVRCVRRIEGTGLVFTPQVAFQARWDMGFVAG